MSPFDIAIAASGQVMFRVVTARGVPIASIPATPDQRKAMQSAKVAVATYEGCYVEELEIVVRRRRVYRPRVKADPFEIPAIVGARA